MTIFQIENNARVRLCASKFPSINLRCNVCECECVCVCALFSDAFINYTKNVCAVCASHFYIVFSLLSRVTRQKRRNQNNTHNRVLFATPMVYIFRGSKHTKMHNAWDMSIKHKYTHTYSTTPLQWWSHTIVDIWFWFRIYENTIHTKLNAGATESTAEVGMNKLKQNETDFKQTEEEEDGEKTSKTKLIYGWQSHIYGKFLLEFVCNKTMD